MNIFYLHHEPATCARYHCDKHVVKMILEYSQLLSTAHHVLDGSTELGIHPKLADFLLAPTHKNHPSAIWVRESELNYYWLTDLLYCLHSEYTYRYGKSHALWELGRKLSKWAPTNIPPATTFTGQMTPPTLAMPPAVKVLASSLDSRHHVVHNAFIGTYKAPMLLDISAAAQGTERPTEAQIRAIYAYRTYYLTHKAHLLTYTRRQPPEFAAKLATSKPAAFIAVTEVNTESSTSAHAATSAEQKGTSSCK